MIVNGSRVKAHLVLAVDGVLVDNAEVEYVQGEGGLLGGLQEQLLGMEVGDKKECSVPPDQAYGERNDDRLLRVPPAVFGDDLRNIEVGTIVHGVFDEAECDAQLLVYERRRRRRLDLQEDPLLQRRLVCHRPCGEESEQQQGEHDAEPHQSLSTEPPRT